MPKSIQNYLKKSLYDPICINIGRPGSSNLNIRQDVEYVRREAKLITLLDTIQKTPPPVIIFCENKNDVDELNEYLLLKGLDVCVLHSDKDQDERLASIKEFKEGLADIMIATDIASKGLDFNDIEHVINYDMPKEVITFK